MRRTSTNTMTPSRGSRAGAARVSAPRVLPRPTRPEIVEQRRRRFEAGADEPRQGRRLEERQHRREPGSIARSAPRRRDRRPDVQRRRDQQLGPVGADLGRARCGGGAAERADRGAAVGKDHEMQIVDAPRARSRRRATSRSTARAPPRTSVIVGRPDRRPGRPRVEHDEASSSAMPAARTGKTGTPARSASSVRKASCSTSRSRLSVRKGLRPDTRGATGRSPVGRRARRGQTP